MGKRETSFSEFIRDYLDDRGTAYVSELTRAYNRYCEAHDYPPTSYDSARSTVYILKNLGLIEPSHTEPVSGGGIQPRQYYRLAPGALDADWSDPRGQLYGRPESGQA